MQRSKTLSQNQNNAEGQNKKQRLATENLEDIECQNLIDYLENPDELGLISTTSMDDFLLTDAESSALQNLITTLDANTEQSAETTNPTTTSSIEISTLPAHSYTKATNKWSARWNTLTEPFKSKFEKHLTAYENILNNPKYIKSKDKAFMAYNSLVKEWFTGEKITDPNNPTCSAILSNEGLISSFKRFLELGLITRAEKTWRDSPRLRQLFFENKDSKFQHWFLYKIMMCEETTFKFRLSFLSIYPTKTQFEDYLQLINDQNLKDKVYSLIESCNSHVHKNLPSHLRFDPSTVKVSIPAVSSSSAAFFNVVDNQLQGNGQQLLLKANKIN